MDWEEDLIGDEFLVGDEDCWPLITVLRKGVIFCCISFMTDSRFVSVAGSSADSGTTWIRQTLSEKVTLRLLLICKNERLDEATFVNSFRVWGDWIIVISADPLSEQPRRKDWMDRVSKVDVSQPGKARKTVCFIILPNKSKIPSFWMMVFDLCSNLLRVQSTQLCNSSGVTTPRNLSHMYKGEKGITTQILQNMVQLLLVAPSLGIHNYVKKRRNRPCNHTVSAWDDTCEAQGLLVKHHCVQLQPVLDGPGVHPPAICS